MQSLNTIFEEESKKTLNLLRIFSFYAPLRKAFELSNDHSGALVCHFRFFRALKMSDEFEKLVPYLPCLPDDDVIKMVLDIV